MKQTRSFGCSLPPPKKKSCTPNSSLLYPCLQSRTLISLEIGISSSRNAAFTFHWWTLLKFSGLDLFVRKKRLICDFKLSCLFWVLTPLVIFFLSLLTLIIKVYWQHRFPWLSLAILSYQLSLLVSRVCTIDECKFLLFGQHGCVHV